MKRNHNLVHYHLSSTLMIIGIAISFICFFNCMNLYHLLAMEQKEKKVYQYSSQMSMHYLNMEEEDAILGDFLVSDKGIVRMQDVLLFRDQTELLGLADILLCQNEPLIYPVIEGELPETDDEVKEPTVILGRKQIEDAVFENGSYYLIIFLFCFVNIVFVSEYWIKRRYREVAVRKIFGYSDRKIYGLLYRDMVINVSISVLIALGVQMILQCAFDEYLELYKSQFGYYLGYSVVFVFVLSALIMIYPFRLLQKEDVLKQMIAKCR